MPVAEVESGITSVEAQVLSGLLGRERPEATAEIGCANGGSTEVIAQALEQNGKGHHFAVDPFQADYWKSAGKIRLSAANLSHRVTFHDQYPERVFHTLPELDFVFIDGSHLFDFTIMDFVVSDRQLKVGGIMAFHDTWMPSVRSVLRFILLNRSYEPLCLTPVPGRLRLSRWRRFRYHAALTAARWISGESDLVTKRTTFDRLGLDRGNLVFIRKTGGDTRDWRFFQEF